MGAQEAFRERFLWSLRVLSPPGAFGATTTHRVSGMHDVGTPSRLTKTHGDAFVHRQADVGYQWDSMLRASSSALALECGKTSAIASSNQ
jgi:hypothetical protein